MASERCDETPTAAAYAAVLGIVREMAPPVGVESDSELVAELGFDSLGLIELVAVVEDALHLPSIKMEVLAEIVTVGDLQDVVAEAHAATLRVRESQ